MGFFSLVFKFAEKWTEENICVFLVFHFHFVENLVVLGGDFEENSCVDDFEE